MSGESISVRYRCVRATKQGLLALGLAALVGGCTPRASGPEQEHRSTLVTGSPSTGITAVGPLHPGTGFPLWYQDGNGVALSYCMPNDPLCGAVPAGFDPTQPVRFPANFPAEAFYWSATTSAALDASARVDVTMALEATFATGIPQAGQRVTFGRLRIRGFNLPAGSYRITHPFGVDTFVVDAQAPRNINYTSDILPVPESFAGALGSRIGPFLRWDTGAPAGYLGDPAVAHAVTGSPLQTNFVEVAVLDPAADPADPTFARVAFNDQFNVLGKLSSFDAVASVAPGTFGTPQVVTLAATDPTASIWLTTDGSDPTNESTRYTGPFTLDTTTTLTFQAVSADGQSRSAIHRGVYTIDPALLAVFATPAGGVYPTVQAVTLAANDETASIYYTTDGLDPTPQTGTMYGGPISLGHNADVVLKFIAVGAAGAPATAVQTERYSIRVPILTAGAVDPSNGFPSSFRDTTGLALPLCLSIATTATGAPLCVLPPASPTFDPTKPIVFPGNFPGEAFYFSATASLPIPATATAPGGALKLALALEAGFATGVPGAGQQITFGRVRIRAGGLEAGRRYRVTHPYGVDVFDVTDSGQTSINFTEDVLPIPGSFAETQGSRIGPFLSWDPQRFATPGVPDAPPAGFIGIPGVLHPVVGSPFGTDRLALEVWNGTGWEPIAQTDLFDLMGTGASGNTLRRVPPFAPLAATPPGGVFVTPPSVAVTIPAEGARVFATVDGSDPRTSRSRFQVLGAVVLAQSTTLSLVAQLPDGSFGAVRTEIYIVTTPPAVGPLLPGHPPAVPVQIAPLASVRVPTPSNLYTFIKDPRAAVALGKALFWDQQIGSDDVQACATCHFNAGADSRSKNQINPGILALLPSRQADPEGTLFKVGGTGPNVQLKISDFPFHRLLDPNDRGSSVLFDTLNVTSSQGVFNTQFISAVPGAPDAVTFLGDPVFNVAGVQTRRVEPRNTPTVINAVFNYRNFWDGRAQHDFNGVNPFGSRDPSSADPLKRNGFVVRASARGGSDKVYVSLDNSSLASQAVGPVLSPFEMSAQERTFANVGLKMLLRARKRRGIAVSDMKPLAAQTVSPADSVLGRMADRRGKGLTVNYGALISEAFRDEWWSGSRFGVRVNADGSADIIPTPVRRLGDNEFSQIEWNFGLFFGLAVQMYEATLVSDQTPFDRYLSGARDASFSAPARRGLVLFQTKGRCINCHGGAELTNASVSNVSSQKLEQMVMGDLSVGAYDNGFYNIGVRRTLNDVGVGGNDPFGAPLSMARLAQQGRFRDPAVTVGPRSRVVADGCFKVPGLRNVELTAPYFHNGGQLTLRQVVEFYNRGGDFHDDNRANLDSEIDRIGLSEGEKDDLVAFLKSLTDDRVRYQRAPFDHPELIIPDGHPGDANAVPRDPFVPGRAQDWNAAARLVIPAVGSAGGAPLRMFLDQAQ